MDNGWLLTILFPGKTGWWDATRLTYQAYQAPFNYCQLRDVIWARNTRRHWKEMPNNCSIWKKMLSANSKTQMTLAQICSIMLWSNYKNCILLLATQTRPWAVNNMLVNDCTHPSASEVHCTHGPHCWLAFEWPAQNQAVSVNYVTRLQLWEPAFLMASLCKHTEIIFSQKVTFKIQPQFFLWIFPAATHWLPHPTLRTPSLRPSHCSRVPALLCKAAAEKRDHSFHSDSQSLKDFRFNH